MFCSSNGAFRRSNLGGEFDLGSGSPSPFDRLRSLGRDNDEFDSGMRSNSMGTRFSRFLSSIALGLSMMMHAVADEKIRPGASSQLQKKNDEGAYTGAN